jgi:hypothetical protein
MSRILVIVPLFALMACGSPTHLGYDYGRAYQSAFTAQADLARPSAANQNYVLYGIEGVKIRLNVAENTTVAKSGENTLNVGQ